MFKNIIKGLENKLKQSRNPAFDGIDETNMVKSHKIGWTGSGKGLDEAKLFKGLNSGTILEVII